MHGRNRPHNALKLPFFVVVDFAAAGIALVGLVEGTWWLAVGGGFAAVLSSIAIITILRGANPPWLRSRLDPPAIDN